MTAILLLTMLAFMGYSAFRAIKASGKVQNLSDFFSFGPEIDPSALRRAFQATNISFTTAFVSLYLFTFSQGYFAFFTPLAFCLGILVYAYFFLPRQIKVLEDGYRFPELLARAAEAPSLRPWVAVFVIFSLWIFTFAEVQGLNLFLGELFSNVPVLAPIFPIILVIGLGFYISRSGYRATVANDKVQVRLIFLGALAVIVLSVIAANQAGWGNVASTAAQLANPFGSPKGLVMFLVETLVGFIFSQLLYYDNWQRLSFYVVQHLKQQQNSSDEASESREETRKELAQLIRKEYIRGSGAILLVFAAPILLGLSTLAGGTATGDINTLAGFFKSSWDATVAGPILVILSFIFMLSALLSTAESYVIAFVNSLVEDIFGYRLRDAGNSTGESQPESRLEAVRVLTMLVALSLVPFLLIRPSFDTLFIYLFYSANGFVGPLVFLTFRRRLKAWAVLTSLLLGFIYPLPVFFPAYAEYAPYPGLVPVLASLLLVGIFSSKRTNN